MTGRDAKKPLISSITSGKGGVGKTFVTVNLAACLAKAGRKVLVVDCDLGLANIDIMLGLNPERTLRDVVYGDLRLEDVIVPTKGGFDLVPASSGIRDMAQPLFEKIEAIKEMILTLRGYDHILLDTGAGISEVVLQFNLLASRNIVVINRELTCLTDAYAMIKVMFQVFGWEAFSILVNSAEDDREGERIFRHTGSVCQKFLGFNLHYLGCIFQDEGVPRSILKQQIVSLSSPKSRVSANFYQIARSVAAWSAP